jgi:hypothetical protein
VNYGFYGDGDEHSGSITMENFVDNLISVACEMFCIGLLPACGEYAHPILFVVHSHVMNLNHVYCSFQIQDQTSQQHTIRRMLKIIGTAGGRNRAISYQIQQIQENHLVWSFLHQT